MDGKRIRFGWIFSLAVLVTLAGCLPVFPRVDPATKELTRLPIGEWVAVPLATPAMSSDGSSYELDIKRGSSDNLIIFFAGGGAAWDAESAFHPLTLGSIKRAEKTGSRVGFYSANISRLAPLFMVGILDDEREDNPFADWTIVYLPYTTADFFMGDNTVEYELDGAFMTMRYNGYNNAMEALDWISTAVPSVDKLLVAGQSAGGFAAAAWFDRIASRYPGAELYQYSDSSFLVSQHADEVVREVWKAQPSERFGLGSTVNVMDSALRFILDKYGAKVTVLQSQTIADSVLPFYESQLNGEEQGPNYREGWSERMLTTYAALEAQYPNFYYYLTDYGLNEQGETTHTLSQAASFYDSDEDGISLASWLGSAVVLDEPLDVGSRWLE